MERMRGIDANFLYNETPTLHMHTLKVAVLDPSPWTGAPSFELVRAELGRRLHLLPPFRRRIVEVPLGLAHPLWIEDPDFDLEYHVRRLVVPAPGTAHDMDQVIAEVAGRPLDRQRPLWELYVLEGLADGRIGILVKIHHALADGVAAAQLLANVMTTDPDEHEPAPAGPWVPEPVPGQWQVAADALLDAVRTALRLPALVWTTIRKVSAARGASHDSNVTLPRPIFDAPKVSFNRALTPHRSFRTTSLPLATAKRVKNAHAVSLNDVVLATVGGALRAYLTERGELPSKSLTASVPVSTDPPGVTHMSGNHVSNLFTTLATDVADPVERLHTVHDVTDVAKEVNRRLGATLMEDWVEYTPPRPYAWLMREYGRLRLADWHPPPVNVVVSNVAGPRQPLYAAGAALVELYSVGPILEGVGLNVTLWSYLDTMFVGLLACREHVEDLDAIARHLRESLDSLADTVPAEAKAAPAS